MSKKKARSARRAEMLHVLIPCYNEERTVRPAVEEVLAHAPELPLAVKVHVIDDAHCR